MQHRFQRIDLTPPGFIGDEVKVVGGRVQVRLPHKQAARRKSAPPSSFSKAPQPMLLGWSDGEKVHMSCTKVQDCSKNYM
jgi:hypothetical protein